MGDKGINANAITYSAAIDVCAKGGQWQRALGLLDEMGDKGIDANAITYNAAIDACTKGN